ncbi:MAG: hypothetical protein H0W20_08980 [Chthoniobacterales bacterium]|nr:hypothetical protein [Chthoniobacterales bacterium]
MALVEVYDSSPVTASSLANISTRGFVDTGENVLIGGFIVTTGGSAKVVVRAIGPSLDEQGVSAPLADPALYLVDENGSTIAANDDWKTDQQAELEAIGIQPGRDTESALVANVTGGNFTAVVRGQGTATGIALVEVYDLQ